MKFYLFVIACLVIPWSAAAAELSTKNKQTNAEPVKEKQNKRSVFIGDLTYSYAATDIDSKNGDRVKTVTVIKNIATPKLYDKKEYHSFEEKHDKEVKENDGFKINLKVPDIEEAYAQIKSLSEKLEKKIDDSDKKVINLSGAPIKFPKDDLYNVKHLSEVPKNESKEKQNEGKKDKFIYQPPYVAPIVRDGGKISNPAQKTPFIVIDFSKKSDKKDDATSLAEPVNATPIKEVADELKTPAEPANADAAITAEPNNYKEIRTRYPHARVLYARFN